MHIDLAPIRAAVATVPGDVVGLSKAQLDELLQEVEDGRAAKRALKIRDAIAGTLGIAGIDGASLLANASTNG